MIQSRRSKTAAPQESCPLEESLRLLAGEWTPQILWFLRSDARRFGDLKRDLVGISAKVLTTRLRELEDRGILTRTVTRVSPPIVEYALTPLGQKFHPVLKAIARVGAQLKTPLKGNITKRGVRR